MEPVRSSETTVNFYKTTWRRMPEDTIFHSCICKQIYHLMLQWYVTVFSFIWSFICQSIFRLNKIFFFIWDSHIDDYEVYSLLGCKRCISNKARRFGEMYHLYLYDRRGSQTRNSWQSWIVFPGHAVFTVPCYLLILISFLRIVFCFEDGGDTFLRNFKT